MIAIIIVLIIGIISFSWIYLKFYLYRKPEAFIKIIFVDFKENNYFDTILLTIKKTKYIKKFKIKQKYITINVLGFKNKGVLKGELSIINSRNKLEKNFKIKVYKNSTNTINIKINNDNPIYYNSEIIFFCQNSNQIIKSDNFELSHHNSKKRKRLLIYNIEENEIFNIIKNNNDKDLQNQALEKIKQNSNKILLINIYIGIDNSNILIFIEDEKSIIIPRKEEKQFFINFYSEIYYNRNNYNIEKICEDYKKKIVDWKMIFGHKITNLDNQKDIDIYFLFINQGINSLLDNGIISENSSNDFYFILGYMLLYAYFYKKGQYLSFINLFFLNMNLSYQKNYSYIELIRIGVSYIIFSTNNINDPHIKFFDDHSEKNTPYIEGFKFFKNIILDLNEDSDLIFIYTQINSGFGLELMNNKTCFKLSMIPIEDIKSHIIENIPKFFYVFKSNSDIFIATDARTQIMIFNENKILDKSNDINNNIMNITIGMFHESGHGKFHMNSEVGGDRSPVGCINKKFEFIEKYHWNDKTRGETGKFIDYFLYNSNNDEITMDLIASLTTKKLMDKKYFIGNLDSLNLTAKEIVENSQKNNIQNVNINMKNNLSTLSKKKRNFQLDDNDYADEKGPKPGLGDIYY